MHKIQDTAPSANDFVTVVYTHGGPANKRVVRTGDDDIQKYAGRPIRWRRLHLSGRYDYETPVLVTRDRRLFVWAFTALNYWYDTTATAAVSTYQPDRHG